jgi:quinol-cytochrome oxidoreductase complex cytochrome b subunit
MVLPDGIRKEDWVIDVAPDWALHHISAFHIFMFFGGFFILFLPYFGRHPQAESHTPSILHSTAN